MFWHSTSVCSAPDELHVVEVSLRFIFCVSWPSFHWGMSGICIRLRIVCTKLQHVLPFCCQTRAWTRLRTASQHYATSTPWVWMARHVIRDCEQRSRSDPRACMYVYETCACQERTFWRLVCCAVSFHPQSRITMLSDCQQLACAPLTTSQEHGGSFRHVCTLTYTLYKWFTNSTFF